MALREFRDREGVEWLAWDVPPVREFSAARSGQERRLSPTPNYTPERRRLNDRRRMRSATGLERGWLCFQCEHEKRRLAPAPADWHAAADDELEALLQSAQAARHTR